MNSYRVALKESRPRLLKNDINNQYELFFPGTEDAKDIVRDSGLVLAKFLPLCGTLALKTLDKMLSDIINQLNLKGSETITVAGHSLGGYYAECAKLLLINKGFDSINSYSFDSPATSGALKNYLGNKKFNELKNTIQKNDIEKSTSTQHFISQEKNYINTYAGGDHLPGQKFVFVSDEKPTIKFILDNIFPLSNFINKQFEYHSTCTLKDATLIKAIENYSYTENDLYNSWHFIDEGYILAGEV